MNKYRYPSLVLWRRIPNKRFNPIFQPRDEKIDDNGVEIPAHGTYGGLLFDQRWKARRSQIVGRDGGRCIICHSTDELQVHHRQYHFLKAENGFKAPWDYEDKLLITLCKSCHNRGHNKFKVPTLVI
jgi:hypothetical protein